MKRIVIITICLLVLAGLALGGLYRHHTNTYIKIEDNTLRRDVAELTVSGDQLPELELLRQLPLLEVLDDLPREMELVQRACSAASDAIRGRYFPSGAELTWVGEAL